MKRMQITIDDGLDAELSRLAAVEGVSKAELVRRYVAERLELLPSVSEVRGRVFMSSEEFLASFAEWQRLAGSRFERISRANRC
jgi:ABC-type antimicrobial peptide transport system permease subunit